MTGVLVAAFLALAAGAFLLARRLVRA